MSAFKRVPTPLAPVKLSREDRLSLCVTPIFTKEAGARLEIARMKLGISQAELAKDLGVGQQTVSALERGNIKVTREPVTLARWKAVMGDSMAFILYAADLDRFNAVYIKQRYWEIRQKREPKNSNNNESNS